MSNSTTTPTQQLCPEDAQFLRDVESTAAEDIHAYLEGYKNRRGLDGLDYEAFKRALYFMVSTLVSNRLVLETPDTDSVITLSIQAIAKAAVDAKKKVEDKRIILLS